MYRIIPLVYLQYSDWLACSMNLLFLFDWELLFEFSVLPVLVLRKFSPNKHVEFILSSWNCFVQISMWHARGTFRKILLLNWRPWKKLFFLLVVNWLDLWFLLSNLICSVYFGLVWAFPEFLSDWKFVTVSCCFRGRFIEQDGLSNFSYTY